MTRLLALAALAIVLWMFLKIGWARLKRAVGAGTARRMKSPEIPLIRCSGCGVHVRRGQVVSGLCEQCRLPERT